MSVLADVIALVDGLMAAESEIEVCRSNSTTEDRSRGKCLSRLICPNTDGEPGDCGVVGVKSWSNTEGDVEDGTGVGVGGGVGEAVMDSVKDDCEGSR